MHLNVKDCTAYYCTQAGGGSDYFHGIAHQRGYGFFGELRRYISPLAMRATRYLGAQLLNTGKNVINDVASGTSIKDSARNRFRETSTKIKSDFLNKLQQGQGKKAIKRKRKKNSNQSRSKRCKVGKSDVFS